MEKLEQTPRKDTPNKDTPKFQRNSFLFKEGRKNLPPCAACTGRHAACHGTCEAYKEWKASRDARNAAAWQEGKADREYVDYMIRRQHVGK